jgi:hypothetical protein
MRRASSEVSTFGEVGLLARLSGIDVGKGLAISVEHLEASRRLLDLPGSRETAAGHDLNK